VDGIADEIDNVINLNLDFDDKRSDRFVMARRTGK
jgi:hypothetical protein